jgi:diguanylate cyclase (GGDEF) domain
MVKILYPLATMRKINAKSALPYAFYSFPLLIFLLAVFSSRFFVSTYQHSTTPISFSGSLDLYNDSSLVRSGAKLPQALYVGKTSTFTLSGTIPYHVSREMYISLSLSKCSLEIKIDGQHFFTYNPESESKYRNNLESSTAINLKISPEYYGRRVDFIFTPDTMAFEYFNLPNILYGSAESIFTHNTRDVKGFFLNLTVLFCVLFFLIVYILLSRSRKVLKRVLAFLSFYLDIFVLFSGMQAKGLLTLFTLPYLSGHINAMALGLLPPSLILFLRFGYNTQVDWKLRNLLYATEIPVLLIYFATSAFLCPEPVRKLILVLEGVMELEIAVVLAIIVFSSDLPSRKLRVLFSFVPFLLIITEWSGFELFFPLFLKRCIVAYPSVMAIIITSTTITDYFNQSKILIQKSILKKAAYTDTLSSCYNRKAYQHRMENSFFRSYWYVLIDLDNLKKINDEKGHAEGDRAIRAVGDALLPLLRSSSSCYRIGGDEFAILIPQSDLKNIESFVHTISDEYAYRTDYLYSLSAGWSVITKGCSKSGIEEAIKKADDVMYRAKKAKKGGAHEQ